MVDGEVESGRSIQKHPEVERGGSMEKSRVEEWEIAGASELQKSRSMSRVFAEH